MAADTVLKNRFMGHTLGLLKSIIWCFAGLAASWSVAEGRLESRTLRLSPCIGTGMVVPMDRVWTLSGDADPEARVEVSFSGEVYSTRADEQGRWQVVIRAQPPNPNGQSLIVVSGDERVQADDILIGRLWICAGQSNMDFPLRRAVGGSAEIKHASTSSTIRLFNAHGPPTDSRPYDAAIFDRLESEAYYQGQWNRAVAAADFSAIGWWAARLVQEATGDPIGVIDVSVGGSGAEAWLPQEIIEAEPTYQSWLKQSWLDDPRVGNWVRTRARQNLGQRLGAAHPFRPGILFERGVRPWCELRPEMVLWYQGESNAENPDIEWNQQLLRDVVAGWRAVGFGPELKFLVVELPEIGGNDPLRAHWPAFRQAQRQACATLENTRLISTTDLGWPDNPDVHQPEKRPIAERIAAAILSQPSR